MKEQDVLENRIIPMARDVRASAGRLHIATGKRPGSLVESFITALLARYLGRQEWHFDVDFSFQRRLSTIMLQPVYQRLGLNLAPRLALTVLAPPRPSEASSIPAASVERIERIERQVDHELILQPAGTAVQKHLVARLITERKRVEAQTMPERQRTNRDDTEPFAPSHPFTRSSPAPMTMQHPATVRADNHTPNAAPDGAKESQAQNRFSANRLRGNATESPEAAAIDVNRLTDQVIQAIDQRIITQRERIGSF